MRRLVYISSYLSHYLSLSLQQRKMDTLKRRKAREQMRLSAIPGDESGLEGDLDELIARLYSGEPWNDFGGKRRSRRASTNSSLTHAWMQVSRERIDVPEEIDFGQHDAQT